MQNDEHGKKKSVQGQRRIENNRTAQNIRSNIIFTGRTQYYTIELSICFFGVRFVFPVSRASLLLGYKW